MFVRSRTAGNLLVAVLVALFASLLLVASPDAVAQAVTPIEAEPPSLRAVPDQHVFDHTVTPTTCTAVVDRDLNVVGCVEVISDWICPAGVDGSNPLSDDARSRFTPYNYTPETADRAYLDSHCILVETHPLPVPDETVDCPEGGTAVRSSEGRLVCVVVVATPTATPTPTAPPVQVPVPAFTG